MSYWFVLDRYYRCGLVPECISTYTIIQGKRKKWRCSPSPPSQTLTQSEKAMYKDLLNRTRTRLKEKLCTNNKIQKPIACNSNVAIIEEFASGCLMLAIYSKSGRSGQTTRDFTKHPRK